MPEWISDKTELELGGLSSEFSMASCGRREVTFDGVVNILKYESDCVILKLKCDTVSINGVNIELKKMYRGEVTLGGLFNKIEFGG